jgi:replicative DNA helicase
MSVFQQAFDEIERGRQGLNMGLPTGLPRFDGKTYGLQRGTYTLIGGDTGSGKSHFLNNTYLLNPLDYLKRNPGKTKLKVIYLSFEMVAKVHIFRAIPRYLWENHGIITDIGQILSKGLKNRVPDEIYEKISESREWFEELESHITFVDSTIGRSKIEEILKRHAVNNGTFIKDQEGNLKYTPNDPNLITLVILDHNGLSKKEDEASTKQIIDGISKVFVKYRNTCDFTFVALNQFNRDIQSTDRKKAGAIEPQLSDFKDTSGSQEDADMVLALCDPWRYGYTSYKDFDIATLQSYFRCLHILKNRSGSAGGHIGLNFFGNTGIFQELPRVKDMTQQDYARAINLADHRPDAREIKGGVTDAKEDNI